MSAVHLPVAPFAILTAQALRLNYICVLHKLLHASRDYLVVLHHKQSEHLVELHCVCKYPDHSEDDVYCEFTISFWRSCANACAGDCLCVLDRLSGCAKLFAFIRDSLQQQQQQEEEGCCSLFQRHRRAFQPFRAPALPTCMRESGGGSMGGFSNHLLLPQHVVCREECATTTYRRL